MSTVLPASADCKSYNCSLLEYLTTVESFRRDAAVGRKRKESNRVLRHPTFDALTHAAFKISILDQTTACMEKIKLSPIDGCKVVT
jgi:hypothetical protein